MGFISKRKCAETADIPMTANMFYYLPEASLTVTATATVIIETNYKDGSIVSKTLSQLQLDIKVNIQPDTDQLLLINHKTFAYANDELRLTTGSNGLLETVSVSTEDRIGSIIAQVAQAPAQIATVDRIGFIEAFRRSIPDKTNVQVKTFTSTFQVTSSELDSHSFSKKWLISIEGIHVDSETKTVDASFKCALDPSLRKQPFTDSANYYGLLTRPVCKKKMSVYLASEKNRFSSEVYANYDLFIPDKSTFVKIPIERTSFTKNISTPKFSSGLLIENYINRPSPFEGFLSIPINIAKAFASIPAVIFGFQKNNILRQTELLQLKTELAKAQLSANVALEKVNANQQSAAETLTKSFLEERLQQVSQIQRSEASQEEEEQERTPKLGKLPPSDSLHLEMIDAGLKVTDANLLAQPHGVFTDPGKPFSWLDKLRKLQWDDYNNFNIPDCVPAAGAHMITSWSTNTSQIIIPGYPDVKKAYDDNKQSMSSDGEIKRGCSLQDFLDYWSRKGLGTDKLANHIQIKEKSIEFLTLAVYYYGGCLVGLRMPRAIKNLAVDQPWDVPDDQVNDQSGDWAADSWGGHAVPVLGVNGSFLEIVSWNRIIRMSLNFYKIYNDESHALLSDNWFLSDGLSPLGPPYDKNFLNKNLSTLSKYV